MKSVLFLFGTRPEAIKMAPLIKTFSSDSKFSVKVGVTAQHREMLDQVLDFFDINVDYDLNVMTPNQTLHQLTATLIERITTEILDKENFDYVFVQGDTTTVLTGALAAFYKKIKVVHIEAGLRSGDMHSPFPEEMNRVLTSNLATYHFCPTKRAVENLGKEGLTTNVYEVGNTVIDALLMAVEKNKSTNEAQFLQEFRAIDFSKKIILVTCHRRENFGEPFITICDAINTIAEKYNDSVEIVYPVHLNPNVKEIAHQKLTRSNIKLIAPLDYPQLVWMMSKSTIVLTDSGGIQEEAPSLGKPVLVLRNVTERTEGVDAGTAILVGTDREKIVSKTAELLDDVTYYKQMSHASNPYGKGDTSELIRGILG